LLRRVDKKNKKECRQYLTRSSLAALLALVYKYFSNAPGELLAPCACCVMLTNANTVLYYGLNRALKEP
jgi:hypothetical protein